MEAVKVKNKLAFDKRRKKEVNHHLNMFLEFFHRIWLQNFEYNFFQVSHSSLFSKACLLFLYHQPEQDLMKEDEKMEEERNNLLGFGGEEILTADLQHR